MFFDKFLKIFLSHQNWIVLDPEKGFFCEKGIKIYFLKDFNNKAAKIIAPPTKTPSEGTSLMKAQA